MESFVKRMKAKNQRELDRVNRLIAELMGEPQPAELESGGDNTPLSEVVDAIRAGEEKHVRSELLGRLIERAESLRAALLRIRQGTYGPCSDCGKPIDRQRLEAVPEAVLCLRCQKQLERPTPVVQQSGAA